MPAADAVGEIEPVERPRRVVLPAPPPRLRQLAGVVLGLPAQQVGVPGEQPLDPAPHGGDAEVLLVVEEPRPQHLPAVPGHPRSRIEARRLRHVLVRRQHALADAHDVVRADSGVGDDQVRGVRRPLRLDRPVLHAEGRRDAPRQHDVGGCPRAPRWPW
ncbi:hypothetical protein B1L11_20685 [Microbispora sp. GKU 823]|nr:hypothetical protein B1L11_20685 [Microbispora sp. GKU 823]